MIRLFYKIYNFFYLLILQLIYKKRLKINGKIKAKGYFRLEISKGSKVILEGPITFEENCFIYVRKNANLHIKKNCFFNRYNSIICRESILIEDNCMFGESVKIYDHDHLFENSKIYSNKYKTAPIIIKNNCWIANNVNILKNSIIPTNTIIGAMSIVNKQLQESGIYVGQPVKLIKENEND